MTIPQLVMCKYVFSCDDDEDNITFPLVPDNNELKLKGMPTTKVKLE